MKMSKPQGQEQPSSSPPPLILPDWVEDPDWGYLYEPPIEEEEYVCAYSETLRRSNLCPRNEPHCNCGQADFNYPACSTLNSLNTPDKRTVGLQENEILEKSEIAANDKVEEKVVPICLTKGRDDLKEMENIKMECNYNSTPPIDEVSDPIELPLSLGNSSETNEFNIDASKPKLSADATIQTLYKLLDFPCSPIMCLGSAVRAPTSQIQIRPPDTLLSPPQNLLHKPQNINTVTMQHQLSTSTPENFQRDQRQVITGGPPGICTPPPNRVVPQSQQIPRQTATNSSSALAPFKVLSHPSRNDAEVVFRFPNEPNKPVQVYQLFSSNGKVFRISNPVDNIHPPSVVRVQINQNTSQFFMQTSSGCKTEVSGVLNPADMVDPPNVTCLPFSVKLPGTPGNLRGSQHIGATIVSSPLPQILNRTVNISASCGGQVEKIPTLQDIMNVNLQEFSKLSLTEIAGHCNMNQLLNDLSKYLSIRCDKPADTTTAQQGTAGPAKKRKATAGVVSSVGRRKVKKPMEDPLGDVEDFTVTIKETKPVITQQPVKSRRRKTDKISDISDKSVIKAIVTNRRNIYTARKDSNCVI